MNTTSITNRRRWFATIAAVAATTAIACPIATGPAAAEQGQRRSSTVDDEYRKMQSRPSESTAATIQGRPCFIIQSHWNPAYDGFVPVCERPREQPVAERTDCQPPIDPRYVGVPWDPRVSTGCESRDRWWIQAARR